MLAVLGAQFWFLHRRPSNCVLPFARCRSHACSATSILICWKICKEMVKTTPYQAGAGSPGFVCRTFLRLGCALRIERSPPLPACARSSLALGCRRVCLPPCGSCSNSPPPPVFSLGWTPPQKVMFEDSFKNLVTAKSLGMSTVFIQSDTAREEGVSEEQLETVDAVVRDVRRVVSSLFLSPLDFSFPFFFFFFFLVFFLLLFLCFLVFLFFCFMGRFLIERDPPISPCHPSRCLGDRRCRW